MNLQLISNRRRSIATLAVTAALVCASALPAPCEAQQYPSKPIHLILPFPPGGVTDLMGRTLAEKLSQRFGQPVIVENRTGAGTVLASDYVARSAPDGYTILLAASSVGTAPLIYDKVDYDPFKSFVPITQVASVVHILEVSPSLPINSVAELIAYARQNPGKLNYGSTGTGTSTHLEAELLKSMAGISMTHIPYKGSGPALVDMMTGSINVMIDPWGSSGPMVRAGKLRALAVTTAKRSQSVPDLPTVAESGLPGYEAMPWLGFMAPAGTPAPIVDKLYREVGEILKQPEMRDKFKDWGFDIIGNSPTEFSAFLVKDVAQWEKVIRGANIKAE